MEDDEDSGVVRYRRRLDRTPEKEFERLPDTEKKLLSTMRGALENCRKKVDRLKDDLTDREKAVEVERTRRKEAEERLRSYLVDPYPTPEVNSELRRRLPRASKSDPLLGREDDASTDEAEGEQEEETLIKNTTPKVSSSPGRSSSKKSKKKVRRALNFQSQAKPSFRTDGQDVADGDVDEDASSSSGDDQPPAKHSGHRDRGRNPRQQQFLPPQYPPPYNPHYTVGYPLGLHTSPYSRPFPLSPWSSASSLNMFPASLSPRSPLLNMQIPRVQQSASMPSLSSLSGDGVSQTGMAGVREHIQSASMTTLSAPKPDTSNNTKSADVEGATANTANDTTANAPQNTTSQKPVTPNLQSHSATSVSSHYNLPSSVAGLGGAAHGYSLPPLPSYPLSSFGLGLGGPSGDLSARQLSFLYEEIGRLKEANKQLSDKLMLSGQELEALKLQITAELPDDGTFDGQAAKKLAEYMEQVKTAEEKREKAMEARLRQAEEDRDEALHSLARSRQQAASYKKDEAMERDRDRNRREATEDTQYRKASVYQRPGKHLDMSDSSSEFESDEEEFLMREKTGVKGQSSRHDNTEGSSSDTDRRGAKLLREVERRQQREREMYQEELQVVLEQRDQAVEQLRREREKQQLQQIRMPGQREQMLMAKITVLQREKDKAYAMVHQLQEEQYDINLLSSLHKALFSDSAVNEASTVYAHEGKLNSKLAEEDEIARPNLKEDNQLLEQLRQASQQNSVLMQRCEELEAECTREKEEKNKLERLNGVLRKKLITFSTGSGQVEEE